MNLHHNTEIFQQLTTLTSLFRNIPESAIRRDYWIVYMFNHLSVSEYVNNVVFKGGTSLSKCYPNSIERFSEDIDLTFTSEEKLSAKQLEKHLKAIEMLMTKGLNIEKIEKNRNARNKSSYVWFDQINEKVKFEIGSAVRPHPRQLKTIKSYIQEYLEFIGNGNAILTYGLKEISIQVLDISRTFVDKLFAIKRHSLCGTINEKVRHIYDVMRVFELDQIKKFLENHAEFKEIVSMTKSTDAFYLEKRSSEIGHYNSLEPYNYDSWKVLLQNEKIRESYERMHIDLLYTNEKQSYDKALGTLDTISQKFVEIGE